MKIIKNNTLPQNTAIVTCIFCSSILEVTPDDLHELSYFVKENFCFTCPCCKKFSLVLDNSVLSSDFRKRIKKVTHS